MTGQGRVSSPEKRPYPAGTFVLEVEVPEGHDIGHGQLLARLTDALKGGPVSPYPLRYVSARTSFRPAEKGSSDV